jgi:hypothetical protein
VFPQPLQTVGLALLAAALVVVGLLVLVVLVV